MVPLKNDKQMSEIEYQPTNISQQAGRQSLNPLFRSTYNSDSNIQRFTDVACDGHNQSSVHSFQKCSHFNQPLSIVYQQSLQRYNYYSLNRGYP